VHQAAQRYGERRDAYLAEQCERLREATRQSVEGLLAMNLPASLQAIESSGALPEVGFSRFAFPRPLLIPNPAPAPAPLLLV
jgi:hypothetical protein